MLNPKEYRLLDVGGTYIKRPSLQPVPVNSSGSRDEISSAFKKAIGNTEGLKGIGIAIPGPFDFRDGVFRMDHKFAAVKGEDFRTLAGVPDNIGIRYIHDVNSVLEGAIKMMGLEGQNTALVSLGTGLGFSLAIGGKVRYGPTLSPADVIWNMPWEGGILEDRVSARGLRNIYGEVGGDAHDSAASIAIKAFCGERDALEAFCIMGDHLGRALKGILAPWNVQTLLFSGQVSRSLLLMEDSIRKYLGKTLKMTIVPDNAVYEGISGLFEN